MPLTLPPDLVVHRVEELELPAPAVKGEGGGAALTTGAMGEKDGLLGVEEETQGDEL